MQGIDLTHHHAVTSSPEVQNLCLPLLQKAGITYFHYTKVFHQDASRAVLCNHPSWIQYYYQNTLFLSQANVQMECVTPTGYFLWSEMPTTDRIYQDARHLFDITHGITFVIKAKNITYLYMFATYSNNETIHCLYSKNISFFQKFIHYFMDKGHRLIKIADRQKIFLPNYSCYQKMVQNTAPACNPALSIQDTSRYFLLNVSEKVYLTQQQAFCASLLLKGYSSKYIAKIMRISFRTVEGYIMEMRAKVQEKIDAHLTKEMLLQILQEAQIPIFC